MFNFKDVKYSYLPYKHWIIEDFLDRNVAEELLLDFPYVDSRWYKYNNYFEKKYTLDNSEEMPAVHASALAMFNSRSFIEPLEKLTGIEGLVGDPWFRGGGLHQILPGGKLDVHADFNVHPKLKLKRRLNALLYLNKDWKPHWNGDLQLWEKDMSKCHTQVWPHFNKLVIFETNDDSFHGHPEELTCPDGVTRKSLALYYYTAPNETLEPHAALFKLRPGEETNDEIEAFRLKRNKGSK